MTLLDDVQNAIGQLKDDRVEQPYLIGTPKQIEVWKKMFGERVRYVISEGIQDANNGNV